MAKDGCGIVMAGLLLFFPLFCQAARMEHCVLTAICAAGAAMLTSRSFTCEAGAVRALSSAQVCPMAGLLPDLPDIGRHVG